MSDDSGEWIVNRYQLQQPICRGAMGTVYQALDARLGRTVAVKFLAQTLQSVEMCDRFEVEAKAAAQLSAKTQYVVSVSDYGVDQSNRPFYVMEYLQGTSLKNRMRPSLPLPVFLNLTQQICLGLQCAHEGIQLTRHAPRYPVIHCDLKPSNIFVTSEPMLGEAIRILDFGIASLLTNDSEQIKGFRGGTLPYCSPEQLNGQTLDPRSDLYSLGIVMFEMLTGKLPLYPRIPYSISPKFQDWQQVHQSQPPRSLTEAAPDRPFPKSLETLILRCLAKQPNDRPQSATQILQVLRELGSQFGTQSPDDLPVDSPASETAVQNQSVVLPKEQRSTPSLIWRGSIRPGRIMAQSLFAGREELATIWCMLPHARIQTIQIHQQYNTVRPHFLFLEHPHPMLLWVTTVCTPGCRFVWLPYYLDMKQPKMLHLAHLLTKGIYQVLFFDFESPHSCSHTLSLTLAPENCRKLGFWIMQSYSLPAGSPAASRQRLEAEYERLKRQIEEQCNKDKDQFNP
ncbi:protein kinase domain-containing protein [Leptodesmis sichuanensis]|uniref:protein kinase domain-containing protein n=1 Tax=Leptodesmis sichuanensis TaxID=2906798 RepID=UPI001F446FF8|nr:protein kinase [Leptodesmis sichuanensis]UIE36251.1 serine/threonine protein kinase [Leptodesmis sichuanensis A121]